MSNDNYPIANADEARDAVGGYKQKSLFLMWFGAYSSTHVYVWADHLEDAWEESVEWLDDEGHCGIFTTLDESDFREAAEELGYGDEFDEIWETIQSGVISGKADEVLSGAETDLTMISHTSLTNCEKKLGGGPLYVPSWEWGGGDVTSREEFDDVLQRSFEEIYDEQVTSPGKFEGDAVYVPYLYEEEGADEEFTGHPELALGWLGRYDIDDDDRRLFVGLKGRRVVYLFERTDGFVEEIKPEGAEAIIKDMEASWEDDEETG